MKPWHWLRRAWAGKRAASRPAHAGPAAVPPGQPPGTPLRMSLMALAGARGRADRPNTLALPDLPPGVAKPTAAMALDDAGYTAAVGGWMGSTGLHEGIGFVGYPLLAELAQRPEYRKASEIIASEMTREWVKLKATGRTDKTERIKAIEEAMRRFRVREVFREAIEMDGFFGRGQIFIDLGNDDPEELKIPLVIGPTKIGKKSLRRLTVVDPTWTSPQRYDASDPLDPAFYNPQCWNVMSKAIHTTRLISIVSRPVPTILRPAYNFSGLSLSQMLIPYVQNWLRTRQSVSDLLAAFTVWNLQTNLTGLLGGGSGDQENIRIDYFNLTRDNRGVMVTDKETEALTNISAPLSTLDHLQAQSQEHMASVTSIPLVKLLGITPSGLNASSDGEVRMFYDWIATEQERMIAEPLRKIIDIIQLSEFGDIDPEITAEFVNLWQLDEAQLANVRKTRADTDVEYLNAGVISPDEVRRRIAGEEDSDYAGLDLSGRTTNIDPDAQLTHMIRDALADTPEDKIMDAIQDDTVAHAVAEAITGDPSPEVVAPADNAVAAIVIEAVRSDAA